MGRYKAGLVLLAVVLSAVSAHACTDAARRKNAGDKNSGNIQTEQHNTGGKDDAAVDSCAGPAALLSELDRPTVSDSVCSVRKNHVIAEFGYDYQVETGNTLSTLQTFPQAELRYGVGHRVELKLFPPDYLIQAMDTAGRTGTANGFGDAGAGVKYEFGYGEKYGFAADTAVTFASGSKAFTANGTGVTVNGIFAYNVNEDIGIGVQVGLSHVFGPVFSTQQSSLNPIIVVTDQLNEITSALQLYAECYNTIDLMHGTGVASFVDAGVQYLVFRNVEVDAEAGHNLTNLPSHNTTYVGFGTGIEF